MQLDAGVYLVILVNYISWIFTLVFSKWDDEVGQDS